MRSKEIFSAIAIAICLNLFVFFLIRFSFLFLVNPNYGKLFDTSFVLLGIIPIIISFFTKNYAISAGLNFGGLPILFFGGLVYAYNDMQYYFSLNAATYILALLCVLNLIIWVWYMKSLRKKDSKKSKPKKK